jgi:hypothetical protein
MKSSKFLLQSDVERAMKMTRSNVAAAKYLRVSLQTYKKYAMRYFDESGVSLYEKHKNQAGKLVHKTFLNGGNTRNKVTMEDIFDNKHPNISIQKFKDRLINRGYIAEKCNLCGFDEHRVTDMQIPLLLSFKDCNKKNFALENLELLCYNCYYLTVGNIIGQRYKVKG